MGDHHQGVGFPRRKVRVGIVGLGFGKRVLIPAFRLDRRCVVLAVCSKSRKRANLVAQEMGISRAYGSWRELVDDPDVDLIVIATPPNVQARILPAALESGKHVFCEKPLAHDPKAARKIWTIAQRSRMAHVIDFEFSCILSFQKAKTLLDQKALGVIDHVLIAWQVETPGAGIQGVSWKTDPRQGGGALNLFVSHVFYYLEWLLGPIDRMSVRLFNSTGGSSLVLETGAIICLVLRDRVPVSVTVNSRAFLGTGHRIEVYGSNGTLILENPERDYIRGFKLWYGSRLSSGLKLLCSERRLRPLKNDGRIPAVGRLVRRLVDWVLKGNPTSPNLKDGYRNQCLLEAARQAHRSGGWIRV